MHPNMSSRLIRSIVFLLLVTAATITIFTVKGYYKDGPFAQPTPTPIVIIEEKIIVPDEPEKTINVSLLNENVKSIGELAAFQYLYTDSAYSEDASYIKDFKLPLTTNSFVIQWDGVIKAGIDATKIKVDVDDNSKEIKLTVPRAQILSHDVDNSSFAVLNEKNNIFNPIDVGEVNELISVSKGVMEKRAVENGILENADAEIKSLLSCFVLSMPDVSGVYTLIFSYE